MLLSSKIVNQTKPLLFLLLIMPSIILVTMLLKGSLGVNPIDKLMDELGQMALRLLICTLVISSLVKIKYLRSLQNIRRMVGLFAFYYISLHLITYIALDHFFNWNFLLKDIFKRPFITFGFMGFILLIPLTITSTNRMIQKLSYNVWKNIHKLIYVATLLGIIHFYLLYTLIGEINPWHYRSV